MPSSIRRKPKKIRVSVRAPKRRAGATGKRKAPAHAAAPRRYMAAARPASRSGYERDIMRDMQERGISFEYEPDTFRIVVPVPRVKCSQCGSPITRETRYTPDFKLPGHFHYIEAKGKLAPNEQRRLLAFKEQWVDGHPERRFRIMFMRNNWLTKKKRARYVDWADKHGIECAVGSSIPEEWVTYEP